MRLRNILTVGMLPRTGLPGKMSTKRAQKQSTTHLTNHDIIVLAVYLVGGRFRHVDLEDVAVKANEIAPGRFVWRKYKEQINIDIVNKRLVVREEV